jgi:hypothetical protein
MALLICLLQTPVVMVLEQMLVLPHLEVLAAPQQKMLL